jgi:hypothetical protein
MSKNKNPVKSAKAKEPKNLPKKILTASANAPT